MDVPLIEFKDVTKRFGPRTILERVNLQIYEEQVTTIIGLSGSGKSVVLKHIVGLLKPDEGTILFRGKHFHQMKKKEVDACLGRMSYMFQGDALFDSMTVYENVAIPIRETMNLSKAEIDRKDEVLKSIEGLQEELTGLYSRRYFKVRYQTELKRGAFRETYAIVVFTLDNLDAISAGLGHKAAPEAIRCMGVYIDKHFGAVGGFSTRQNNNEFVTVLPNSDRADAEDIPQNFAKDFQEQGIRQIQSGASKSAASTESVEFAIRAGLAQGHQGQTTAELESIIALAKHDQKEIVRLRCDASGKAN